MRIQLHTLNRVDLIAVVATVAASMALAACAKSRPPDAAFIKLENDDLEATLHSDPRFQNSHASVEIGSNTDGSTIQSIYVVLDDSLCPSQSAESCGPIIVDVVRLMLTTPSIAGFSRIKVNLRSRMTAGANSSDIGAPDQGPLDDHTVTEWEQIVY